MSGYWNNHEFGGKTYGFYVIADNSSMSGRALVGLDINGGYMLQTLSDINFALRMKLGGTVHLKLVAVPRDMIDQVRMSLGSDHVKVVAHFDYTCKPEPKMRHEHIGESFKCELNIRPHKFVGSTDEEFLVTHPLFNVSADRMQKMMMC